MSREKKKPLKVSLRKWAAAVYGDEAPHPNTLRKWAREGLIQPAAEMNGCTWFVAPDARYVNPGKAI